MAWGVALVAGLAPAAPAGGADPPVPDARALVAQAAAEVFSQAGVQMANGGFPAGGCACLLPPPTATSVEPSTTTEPPPPSTSTTVHELRPVAAVPVTTTTPPEPPTTTIGNARGVVVRADVTPTEIRPDDGVARVTFVVHNTSGQRVSDLHLVDEITAGGTASGASSSRGRCAVVGAAVDCALGSLERAEQATATVDVSVESGDADLLMQQVSMTGTGVGVPTAFTLSTPLGEGADGAGRRLLGFPGPLVTTLGLVTFVFAAAMAPRPRPSDRSR